MRYLSLILVLAAFTCSAQFDPAGSKSVHKDDISIVAWASSAEVVLGPLQINDSTHGYPTMGTDTSALGPFDGSVLSLGDGGVVTIGFEQSIKNNPGYDFCRI